MPDDAECFFYVAQRRPGPEPRRDSSASSTAGRGATSLNEGRGQNPGETVDEAGGGGYQSPLNEGRGQNPGETTVGLALVGQAITARSTKAGARTPARQLFQRPGFDASTGAQRRPGPEPRRDTWQAVWVADEDLAQRRPGPEPRRDARLRSTVG